MNIKAFSRKFVYPLITSFGVEKIFLLGSTKRILILTYHGVTSDVNPLIKARHLPTKQFESHLKYFKKNFQIESVKDAIEISLSGTKTPQPVISLTFDDGYYNNYSDAYPLLKKYSIPASFYITTQCLINPEYVHWFDQFDLVSNCITLSELKENSGFQLPNTSSWAEIKRWVKTLDTPEKNSFAKVITTICREKNLLERLPESYKRLVTRTEILEMYYSGLMDFGSHSHNHHNLGSINETDMVFELTESKKLLESILGNKIASIAFPDGSYNENTIRQSFNSGYKNLLAVSLNNSKDSEIVGLYPRHGISNTTTKEANIIQINRAFKSSGIK